MVADDSPLLEVGLISFPATISFTQQSLQYVQIEYMRETKILPYYTVATVFVNTPGDLTDPVRLAQLTEMVEEFENLPESWGKNSTFLFYRDFLNFEENSNAMDQDEMTTDFHTLFKPNDLPVFLEWPEFNYWRGFVKLHTVG